MIDARTYIRVHDGMPDHPKIEGLSDKAFRLLIETWCWCSRHLTDGRIPKHLWDRRRTPKAREELLASGLVSVANDTIVIHDYLEHQRSAQQVSAIRDSKQRAASLGNHNRWHKARDLVDPDCFHCANPHPDASQNGSHMRSQRDRTRDRRTDRKTSPETETETETEIKTLAGQEKGGVEVGRHASDHPPPHPLDPYRCPRHQDTDGDPGPCRPCRDARLRQEELADLAQRAAFQADRDTRAARLAARADAVAACDLCDEIGYRGRVVCDHVDRSDRTVRHINTAPGAIA